MSYATVNPYTGKHVASFADATDDEIAAALEKADQVFGPWRETGFAERARVMRAAAALLRGKEFVNHKLIDVVDIDAPF